MMRKFLLAILTMIAVGVSAQDSTKAFSFAYLSYEAALKAMPDYAVAQKKLTDLRAQYEAEMRRVEDDFNRKYEDFLDGQSEFPKTILRKRQTELQELMSKNIAFREEGLQELAVTEQELMAPLKSRLTEAIAKVATEQGLAFVINTDADACPYINPEMGIDISQQVQDALK